VPLGVQKVITLLWPGLESENSLPYIANDKILWIGTATSFILLILLLDVQEDCLHSPCLYFHANNATLSVLSLAFKQRAEPGLCISELHYCRFSPNQQRQQQNFATSFPGLCQNKA